MNYKSLVTLHIAMQTLIAVALGYWHWAAGSAYFVITAAGLYCGWPAIVAMQSLYEELRDAERKHKSQAAAVTMLVDWNKNRKIY
jgi:hypothetical protein